jgi:hypothetical protein
MRELHSFGDSAHKVGVLQISTTTAWVTLARPESKYSYLNLVVEDVYLTSKISKPVLNGDLAVLIEVSNLAWSIFYYEDQTANLIYLFYITANPFLYAYRNKDKVARSVRIVPPDSKLFTVTPARAKRSGLGGTSSSAKSQEGLDQMSTKVAPGMEISYIVKFAPEAKSDYAFDLMVLTEREKFIVPIRAIGCRAMLEFPDSLDFGLVPVKFETEKAVMIRNIGEKTTKWQIRTPQGFKIDKTEGILEVGKSDQLTFAFVPQHARKVHEELVLMYDNMEANIPVVGEAHNDNVYLSKTHIHADATSITLFSHQYY